MSLKAKIEAVIYASEEPVTLAQLMGLLGEEAQAELDELNARQAELPLIEAAAALEEAERGDPDALNAEALESTEPAPDLDEDHPAAQEDETAQEPAAEQENDVSARDEGSAERVESSARAGEATGSVAEEPGEADQPQVPEANAPEASSEATGSSAAEESAAPNIATAEDKAAARARERRLRDFFRSLLDELISDYANGNRGLEVREVAGGFRLATKPEYHDAVRGFVKQLKPPLKLSLQALETLAVVAYKQPITAPEVSEIRGVDSGGVLGSLMARKLVTTAGRKQVIGRPILYKTTKDFLVRFGLKDINELPSIEEFEKMAGELVDAEPVQEEIPMENAGSGSPSDETHGSAPVNEIDSAPEPTHLAHDTPEDLMSDNSSAPEGHMREPADPNEVEPMANTHGSQADGTPNGDSQNEDNGMRAGEEDYEEHNPADDIIVDGRIAGLIPPGEQGQQDYNVDSPEIDAEVQSQEKEGGA